MSRAQGRRAALPPPERVARGLRARLDVTALLALLLPLLTVGALMLVRPADPVDDTHPPRQAGLNLATLTCPSGLGKTSQLWVANATGAAGDVEVRASDVDAPTPEPVAIPAGRPARAPSDRGPVVVRGVDAMAPGLLAGRLDLGPAAASCTVPQPDQWFTGLGAAARHSSVLELVNPDPGPAVADITVIGSRGPVDAPSLRGITVPGGRSLRVDLASEIPLRGELAAHVVVSRGRLGAFAADTFDELGRGEAGVDRLAAQQPATDLLMLGLPAGDGTRTLLLANDSQDEVRAVVRVVTADSTFRPQGLEDVRVPPGAVARVPMSTILGRAVKDGAVGVQVEATGPLTGTLRSFVDGDLALAVPLGAFAETTQAVVPGGRSSVLLSAGSVTSVEVVARRSGGGKKTQSVDLAPGRTVSVTLPEDTELVSVSPRAPVRAAVLTVDGGAAVLGLAELVRTGLVADLRPALP